MCVCVCSPTPVGLSTLANEVIALPFEYMQGSSYLIIELLVAVKRMYVNNINCDS